MFEPRARLWALIIALLGVFGSFFIGLFVHFDSSLQFVDALDRCGARILLDGRFLNDRDGELRLERVRRLRETGVLTGFRAEVEPRALGIAIQALVLGTLLFLAAVELFHVGADVEPFRYQGY